jgi:hypothetical protein
VRAARDACDREADAYDGTRAPSAIVVPEFVAARMDVDAARHAASTTRARAGSTTFRAFASSFAFDDWRRRRVAL